MADNLHDTRVRKDCVLTLCNLSFATNSAQMTSDGATHTLCELCDLRSAISMERISIVFRNLASHQGNVRRMVGAGVVPTLVAIASKGSLDTKIHCMIGLCLISFEPTTRLTMAEEGAIPAIMELSSYIGTRAAVHYCGMAISNIAAESKAQGILVKAGAISTLMAWMDQASHSGNGHKKGSKHHKPEQSEEELMHAARQRVQVPKVEEDELEPLTERFDEPKVKFEERSLPWRKFHIQLRVSEPEPPPLPSIQRPVIVNKKSSRKRAPPPAKKTDETTTEKDTEGGGVGSIGRPLNPVDIENEKILKKAEDKLHASSTFSVGIPDDDLIEELKRKDVGSWAKRTEVSVSTFKQGDGNNYDDDNEEGRFSSLGEERNQYNNNNGDSQEGGFEALFQSMRTGDMPVAGELVPETGSPGSPGSPVSGSPGSPGSPVSGSPGSPFSNTGSTGSPLTGDLRGEQDFSNEIFQDFETTMHDVKESTANSTFGSLGFGNGDFFSHLDSLDLREKGAKQRK